MYCVALHIARSGGHAHCLLLLAFQARPLPMLWVACRGSQTFRTFERNDIEANLNPTSTPTLTWALLVGTTCSTLTDPTKTDCYFRPDTHDSPRNAVSPAPASRRISSRLASQ